MNNSHNPIFENLTAWWNHQDIGRALVRAHYPIPGRSNAKKINMNSYWPSPDGEPDIDGLVQAQVHGVRHGTLNPICEALLETLSHNYGRRGTPMNMSWYLGGTVKYTEASVWIDPFVQDWKNYEVKFDPNNRWVQLSKRLMDAQGKFTNGRELVWLPDLGDALTCFSLMRGAEQLLLDLIDEPDVISNKIRDFAQAFIAAHSYFHESYRQYWPGDASCLIWAPDKTYMCQCDFSVMLSPDMFRQFVIPELDAISRYLKYMVWHLDGYEEVRHLPALLELPYIQAIQIQPGANRPPASSEVWMPVCKKCQEAGKSLFVYANSPEEFEHLAKHLDHAGLMISCNYILKDEADAEWHMSKIAAS
ncbi:MAG: hypothetical protein JW849_06735 [Phycisphaerae bacterium]|nr:hypothetical protein [Phycisphaerae bacterium]